MGGIFFITDIFTKAAYSLSVFSATVSGLHRANDSRNWDYRFCWVRDSSFTIYIFLRMGFTDEADAYMAFISERFRKSRGPDGALPIMFTIRGGTEIPEMELT
jgi:GH15 family glucan-1,4-alpha-glucosidase